MPCNGVFRWSAATGALTLLADDFSRPNGLVLTDDGRRMYIADTQHAHVRLFDVTAEGLLGQRTPVRRDDDRGRDGASGRHEA